MDELEEFKKFFKDHGVKYTVDFDGPRSRKSNKPTWSLLVAETEFIFEEDVHDTPHFTGIGSGPTGFIPKE